MSARRQLHRRALNSLGGAVDRDKELLGRQDDVQQFLFAAENSLDLARQAEIVILLDDGGGAAQSLFEVCSPSMIASTGCG